MLELLVHGTDLWDERTEEFIPVKPVTLKLEHSLLSISKWEFNWETPFFDPREGHERTLEQQLDYIKCMTISPKVSDEVYLSLNNSEMKLINDYISRKGTATWFNKNKPGRTRSRTIWTSELLYFQMIQCGIPFECEKWYIKRLITLIEVCQEETADKKKMSKKDIYARNRALNEARKAKHHTHG